MGSPFAEALCYDADGNLETKRNPGDCSSGTITETFTWDHVNRLTQWAGSQTVSFAYDSFGRRVRKTTASATTWYLWDGDQLLAEFADSNSRTARYAYAYGLAPLQFAEPDGMGGDDVYDVHVDHLDTPRLLTDDSGTPVWRAAYEAFGRAHISTDPDGNPGTSDPGLDFNIRFPGQYYDEETGLHDNRHRYYSPELGRYISAEPIGQFGLLIPTGLRHARAQLAPGGRQANPLLVGRLGANPYSYALNDPIGLYDPDGEFAWAVPLVGGAIGAVSAGFGAASNPDADATTIAAAAAVGFVAGAASTFSFGITNPFAAGAVAGGIAGGLGNLVGQGVAAANSCEDFEPDLASAANSALAGVVGGTVGAAFGPAGLGAAGAASATAQAGAAGATAAWLEAAASGAIP